MRSTLTWECLTRLWRQKMPAASAASLAAVSSLALWTQTACYAWCWLCQASPGFRASSNPCRRSSPNWRRTAPSLCSASKRATNQLCLAVLCLKNWPSRPPRRTSATSSLARRQRSTAAARAWVRESWRECRINRQKQWWFLRWFANVLRLRTFPGQFYMIVCLSTSKWIDSIGFQHPGVFQPQVISSNSETKNFSHNESNERSTLTSAACPWPVILGFLQFLSRLANFRLRGVNKVGKIWQNNNR